MCSSIGSIAVALAESEAQMSRKREERNRIIGTE
jgi:hypothetical protein